MADYILTKLTDEVKAKVVDGKTIGVDKPAVYELVLLQNAIDESGKAVKIKGQKINLTISQIDARIAQLETETSKWKAIKAGV